MNRKIREWEAVYCDAEKAHRHVVDTFTNFVNQTPWLKEHRDFVEKHCYGFGDRSFQWMWKLLIDDMPANFRFLEIGVFKGQIVSLVRMLADRLNKPCSITGVTPLSSFSGVTNKFDKFPDEDYMQHIKNLHAHFCLPFSEDQIVRGDSNSPDTWTRVLPKGPFDIVYVDGCHEYDFAVKDLDVYGNMVRRGGYLVVDDASNFLNMYWGSFPGIEDVSRAVKDRIEGKPDWKEVMAVMHNRIFRKIS
jgi:hypothetical protein